MSNLICGYTAMKNRSTESPYEELWSYLSYFENF